MEEPYGPEWPSEEKIKRQEMVAPEARYIFIKQYSNGFTTECSMNQGAGVEHNHTPCNFFLTVNGGGGSPPGSFIRVAPNGQM